MFREKTWPETRASFEICVGRNLRLQAMQQIRIHQCGLELNEQGIVHVRKLGSGGDGFQLGQEEKEHTTGLVHFRSDVEGQRFSHTLGCVVVVHNHPLQVELHLFNKLG